MYRKIEKPPLPSAVPPQIIQQRQHYYDPHASSTYTKMTTFQPIQQGSGSQSNIPFNNMHQQQQQQQQHLQFYEKSSQLPLQVQNYNKNLSQATQQQRPSPPRHVNTWHHQHAKLPYPSQVGLDPNIAFINHEATG